MQNCSQCKYNIDNDSIFCPNCGKELSSYQIHPSDKNINITENSEFRFTIKNTGIIPIRILDVLSENKNISINEEYKKNIQPNNTLDFFINTKGLIKEDIGQFRILTSADKDDNKNDFTNYIKFRVTEPPKIKIEIKNAISKDGIWYFENKIKELILTINSDSELLYNEICELESNFNLKIKEFPIGNKRSKNYNFLLTGFTDNNTEYKSELKIEFQQIIIKEKLIFKSTSFSKINYDDNNLFEHDCKISNTGRRSNLLEIVKDAEIEKEIKIRVSKIGKNVEVVNVIPKKYIVRNNDQTAINLITDSPWIYYKKSYPEDGDKIVIILNLKTSNLPNELFTKQNYPILFENELEIIYEDTNLCYKDTIIIPITGEIHERKNIDITIDFGTTNSCISYIDPESGDNRPKLAKIDFESENENESATAFRFNNFKNEQNEKLSFLKEKINSGSKVMQLITNLEKYDANLMNSSVFSFKTILKDNVKDKIKISFSDKQGHFENYSPTELTSLYLNDVIKKFESHMPYKVENINITYPATFTQYEKENLKQAVKNLGFEESYIEMEITEPIGLLVNYVFENSELFNGEEKLIGVFDCGGGTTDITIAKYSCGNKNNKTLEYLASDGDSKLGGNYLTYLISKKIYEIYLEKTEANSNEIPFPNDFKISIEIDNNAEEKENYSKIWEIAEKYKCNRLRLNIDPFTLELKKTDKTPSKKLEEYILSSDEFNNSIREELSIGLNKLNSLLSILEEDSIINSETKNLEDKSYVEWNLGQYISIIKIKDGIREEKYKKKFTETSVEAFQGFYSELKRLKIVDSVFIENIKFIGIFEKDEEFIKEFKEAQQKAKIEFQDTQLDVLILGGNSSKLKFLQDLATEIVPVKNKNNFIINEEWIKTGVAKGAAIISSLSEDQLPFSIKNNDMIPYSIGYLSKGKFHSLFEKWTSFEEDYNYFEDKKNLNPKMVKKSKDFKINIYENRDILDDNPNLIPHNKKLQPIIGRINIPENCKGSYVKCEMWYNNDEKKFYYSVQKSDKRNGLYEPIIDEKILEM